LKTPVEEDINGKHQAYSTWKNILSPLQKKVLKLEDTWRRRHQRKTSSILDTCHLFRKNAENLKTPVEEDINGKHQAYSTWKNILSPLQKKVLKLEDICRRRHQRKTSSILDTCHLFRKKFWNLKTPVEEDINGKHQAYSTFVTSFEKSSGI
jgi:endonuclease IV